MDHRRRVMLPAIARAAHAVRPLSGRITGVGQYLVHRPDTKGRTPAGAVAVAVQPLCRLLDAKWTGVAVALKVKPEHQPNSFGFDCVNVELLLDLLSAPLSLNDLVAEGRRRTVPKALLGRLAHRASCVLGYLSGCVFVKGSDDLTNEDLTGIIPRRLRDRDHLDTVLAQLPDRQLHFGDVAEESVECIEHDRVVGMIRRTRALDHVLQHRPPIVGRGLGFDKFLDHDVAVLIAEACCNFPLARNRRFIGILTTGADSVIGRNALGRLSLL